MKLLVSVSDADEAREAIAGGADIVDAKDPKTGALGAVGVDVFAEIRGVVGASRTVTAALGDANDVDAVEMLARRFVERGASLVKVGFGVTTDPNEIAAIISRLTDACSRIDDQSGVIAVAYGDGNGIDAFRLAQIAARSGAKGVLVDTVDKHGPGLTALWSAAAIARWVREVHAHGLLAAVAGKLRVDDLPLVEEASADIAGVRGAVCDGGRRGRVAADRVRMLARYLARPGRAGVPASPTAARAGMTSASARTTEQETWGEDARAK